MQLMTSRSEAVMNQRQTVTVPEGVADTWEAVLQDQDRADITFQCQDGKVAKAHSLILHSASPVLKAMLCSGFREGVSSRIEVQQSVESVQLLLDLVYVGM